VLAETVILIECIAVKTKTKNSSSARRIKWNRKKLIWEFLVLTAAVQLVNTVENTAADASPSHILC